MTKPREKPGRKAGEMAPPGKTGSGHGLFNPTEAQRKTALMLFGLGATQRQVAKHLGVSKGTIERHFQEEFEEGWELANLQLYGALWKKAVKGNDTACLIFLAKNRLGMTDRRDVTSGDAPLPPARTELCLRVEYVFPQAAGAFAPPPADRLPGPEFKGPA